MIGYRFSLLIELIGSEKVTEAKREKRAEIRSKRQEELRKLTEEEQDGGKKKKHAAFSALDYTLDVRQAALLPVGSLRFIITGYHKVPWNHPYRGRRYNPSRLYHNCHRLWRYCKIAAGKK